ncbi:tetratricopeptide repeat protein [Pseudomonas sp. MAC6]|uniref:O-linked N-acetylglucosamine transferase family protein n=1 Tax=Pseudomonas sp. MAC6 TaxID=3401633 RepID=UPI003BF47CD7
MQRIFDGDGMDSNAQWLVNFFRAQAKLGFEEGDYTRTRNSCEIVLGQANEDISTWRLLGDAALASKDSATARRCYERLHELCPKDAEIAVSLGKAYVQLGAWDAAALTFRQALKLEPQNSVAEQMLTMVEHMRQALTVLVESGITTEPGRNDECPCGSGRKYKKCCLDKSTGMALLEALHQAMASEQWQQALSLIRDISPKTLEVRRAEAIASYRLGQRSHSRPLLTALFKELPDDAEVVAALADVELDGKDLPRVEQLAMRALALEPQNRIAWLVLCAFHARMGREQDAEQGLRTVVEFAPDCRMAWERLGSFLRKQRRWDEELSAMREWVERCPENHEAWFQVGFVIITLGGDPQEAAQYFSSAIQIKSDFHEAYCWLGQCYSDLGEADKAVHSLLVGLNIKPDYDLGWILLGGVYQKTGRQRESEGCQMRAIAINPNNGFAWNNLATTYLDANEFLEAEQVIRVALRLAPDFAALWNNLGIILSSMQRIKEAKECFEKVFEIDPGFREVYINLAGTEANYGNLGVAIEHLRGVLDYSELARSNILFMANYHADFSIEQIFDIYVDVGNRFYPKRKFFSYDNFCDGNRKLRIGYVSPDFRQHVCSTFIEPLLANHSREKFEIFAYSSVRSEDSVTERYKGYVDFWRPCVGVSDLKVAEIIRQDRIDILVDLAGHTANNRLAVFALKPAPVQVSWWIGFAYTTGLEAVDYFLSDEEMLPLGCESVFSEKPWRMPSPAVAYPLRSDLPDVNELPALKNGFITFGTLTRPIRLNHRVIRCWAELLKRVPNSKLMLNAQAFLDLELSDHFAGLFAAHGISRDRLDIGCTSPPWPVLASMDIALDCFPHNSGTTLYESLWMGLPYVTLRDRPSMGRVGSLILRGLGRSEWIADTEAEYIDKLVDLASDVERLKKIRAGLREEMRASPLCDAVSFAARVEKAYEGMWQCYCEEGEHQ